MKTKDAVQSKRQFNKAIKCIAQGDKNALENFYSVYGRLIYSAAMSVSKSPHLADEIVNDVLIKICQAAPSLPQIDKPNGWLYTVTSNCAKDRIKTEKVTSEIYDIPQDDKKFESFVANDSFLSMISVLNEEEQQVIILRFIQDLSFKSIAKAIQKPLSTVSSIYYRALEKLKNKIISKFS